MIVKDGGSSRKKIWRGLEVMQRKVDTISEFSEVAFFGANEDGFQWLLQLLVSLGNYDSLNPEINEMFARSMGAIMETLSTKVLCKSSFSRILDIHEFVPESDLNSCALYKQSEFSRWLISEFCSRCGTSTNYLQTTFLKYVSSLMYPNLENFILIYVLVYHIFQTYSQKETILNATELFYLKEVIKDLKRELQSKVLSRMFHHFTPITIPSLVMGIHLLNLLLQLKSLLNEIVEKGKKKKSNLEVTMKACILKSFTYHYNGMKYSVESKKMNYEGKEDRLKAEKPSFMGRNRSSTPTQLIGVMKEVIVFIANIDKFSFPLDNVGEESTKELAVKGFYDLISKDLKFFLRKDASEWRNRTIVELANQWRHFTNALSIDKDELMPTFSSVIHNWLESYKDEMINFVKVESCKENNWKAIDEDRPYNATVRVLCSELESGLELAKGIDSFKIYDDQTSSFDSYFSCYCSLFGQVVRGYLELCYNSFVEEEFPPELL
eukprot:TRINITY_DN4094_c0_g1_i1.p1 TRINITY_DN4094_c0_g1~~TRINITY_DN4094_c0_g1_i1.p1  ORF type:complete len:494 (+),score=99.65 TRINITY_DN4094_c0_g1_i1:698-2179(+)